MATRSPRWAPRRPGSNQEDVATRAGYATSEVFPLTLFAVLGMMVFLTANDLITMFVGLEVLSLPLYVMTGLARRRRLLSQEAALKYFLLGAFSSAFFLFGAALLYGYAGSSDLRAIAAAISTAPGDLDGLLVPGVVLLLVGLLFKVGAVPFHSWTPDAYQGAPTPVTGFMAACTKLAAFGVILRVAFVGVGADRWDWQGGVYVIAVLTMVVGAVLSVTQTDVKRLLAYSSIAHAGFILVGVLAFSQAAIGGVMFYLVAYGFATVAAFGLVAMVRQGGSEASHLSQWAGLGRNHPVFAATFSFLLLAFAGIPLTSGFTAKYAAFAPAVAAGAGGAVLVVIAVLASADHGVRLRAPHRADVLHRADAATTWSSCSRRRSARRSRSPWVSPRPSCSASCPASCSRSRATPRSSCCDAGDGGTGPARHPVGARAARRLRAAAGAAGRRAHRRQRAHRGPGRPRRPVHRRRPARTSPRPAASGSGRC